MKLIILPIVMITYLYFCVAESIITQANQISERVERSQNRELGRSPSVAYNGNK